MADISSPKSSLLSLRMYVMIFVGAFIMCESISALEVLTEETVSLWLNKSNQSILCDVRLDNDEHISGFSWTRIPEGSKNRTLIIKVFKDKLEEGDGIERGDFSLSESRSLVLNRPPTIEDEGQYICRVVLRGAPTEHEYSSTVRVISAPKELYPIIRECASIGEHDEREAETCIIKREAGTSLNLTCEMSRFRPLIDLRWMNATKNDFASYRTLTNNSDGTQSMSLTSEVTASLGKQEFACNVSGEAVSGHKWSIVVVQGVEANGSPLVVIIAIIIAILSVVVVLLIVVVLIVKGRRKTRSKSKKKSKQEPTELERGSVSVEVEEPPVETRLNEGTQTDIPEPQEDEDRMSTDDLEQSQELLNKDDREDSQSNSRGPSQLSSRSDIPHADFGESWVCVNAEEIRKLQCDRDDEGSGGDDPGTSENRPQRPGHLRSVFQGFGNLLDTFNNFIRHEA